ncbi:MAG: ATP synthase F0 subunit C [Oligoflexus sp.]
MIRKFGNVLAVLGAVFVSSFAFAQDGDYASGWMAIGSALAIGMATLGGTLSQGRAADAALSGIARNPSSADKVFTPMIISLALIEFQAIMGFIIAYLWFTK